VVVFDGTTKIFFSAQTKRDVLCKITVYSLQNIVRTIQ